MDLPEPTLTNGMNGHANNMEPMAIIGFATKFPQEATSNENFWKFLLKGRQGMTRFPEDRVNMDAFYHPDSEHGGTFHVKGGHFMLDDPASFDAPFFSVTKTELMTLDPQQRLVLENVYHALENAGIPMAKATSSNTSVFVSGFNHDHLALLNADPETTLKYKPTGASNSIIANRVSWFFDFKAPSLTIDTACSSSMVALHLACESLRHGESNMAVVSGVNALGYPIDMFGMSHHGFLSAEGKCFSFDSRADGYSRGEGVGSIILKPLSAAIRDGDTVRALVRATGVNQDGRTAGLTLPSSTAQENLIRGVYARAGLQLKHTMFVEAHGTGTSAGDPVEANAIAKAFSSRTKDIPLYIGAVKSGVGHLEGGSAIAGIIKSILILESGIIPPNVNFEKPNPKIPTKAWNIEFPRENTPWPTPGFRRISVNSFGVGGTNGHCILDDAYFYMRENGLIGSHNTRVPVPATEEIASLVASFDRKQEGDEVDGPQENGVHVNRVNGVNESANHSTDSNVNGYGSPTPKIFSLSAYDEEGINRNAIALGEYLEHLCLENDLAERQLFDDLAYTLSEKRSSLPWKSYLVSQSLKDLGSNLTQTQGISRPIRARNRPQIGFVFTGQGAQWYAMGRELLVFPVFKQTLVEATSYMKSLGSSWSLLDELLCDKENSRINEPSLAHPACTALQIALVDLLSSWNILPSRVTGHSSGEIAAAYCAGKLSREAAFKVSYLRGYVSSKQISAKGSMMAVGLSEAELQPYIEKARAECPGELIIACFNSPKNNTVSGDERLVDSLKKLLDAEEIFARKLNVLNAYHSAHMLEVAEEYKHGLGDLPFGFMLSAPHEIHMFSTVTGKRIESDHLDAQYWVDNLVSPVRFTQALAELCFTRLSKGQATLRMNTSAENIFSDEIVEIGPHSALSSAIKETIAYKKYQSLISYNSVLNRTNPGVTTILKTVAQLNVKGYHVDIHTVNESSKVISRPPRLLVNLPSYRFNHSGRTLYESRLSKNFRLRPYPRHDLFGAPVPDWNAENPRWRHFIRLHENPWLRDHMVTNSYVWPGVGYLIMAIEASRQVAAKNAQVTGFRLRDISMKRALIIPDTKEGIETCLSMSRMDESSLSGSSVWNKFVISSYNPVGDNWIEHCTGYIAVDYETPPGPIDAGREAQEEELASKISFHRAKDMCQTPVDFGRAYENLQTIGLSFGTLFKNLSNVTATGQELGEVMGCVTIPDIAKSMPKGYMHDHLIHPATMDSVLHMFLAGVMDLTGRKSLKSASIPTFIRDVWVSSRINNRPSHVLRGHAKSTLIAYEKYESDITVWDEDTEQKKISLRGIRTSPLESASSGNNDTRQLCHNIHWKPALELIDPQSICDLAKLPEPNDDEYRYWVTKLQLATMLLVTDALDDLKGFNPDDLEGHLRRYYHWMIQHADKLKADSITLLSNKEWETYTGNQEMKESLYSEVEKHNADGELAIRMGKNIPKVLKKELDPLDLMFGQDDILDRVYDQVVNLGDIPALLRSYLSLLGHQSTNLKILEIGAGTGSSTVSFLEALCPLSDGKESREVCRISEYMFTDISSSFFEKAKNRFAPWRDILEFKVLNVENHPQSQGFESGSYDLIVAGNVVHATADLRKTLAHCHSLLKPGGKLVMQEGMRQDFLWSPLAFGQLPGWWLGVEPIRKWCPFIPASEWDSILRESGFSGVDLSLGERPNIDLLTHSTLVSTALDRNTNGFSSLKTAILTSGRPSAELAAILHSNFTKQLGIDDCSLVDVAELSNLDVSDTVCVSLLEYEASFLANLTEETFNSIKRILATCKGLLWLTNDIDVNPELSMITGLLRTVRWERDLDDANLVTLSVSGEKPPTSDLAGSVTKLYLSQFVLPDNTTRNSEYMLADNMFYSNRLATDSTANNHLTSKFSRAQPKLTRFEDAGRPIKLRTAAPGLLNSLEWVTDLVYSEPLGDTQVEIEIKAVGLNFRDLMIAMGEHMAYSMGNEAAGVITRVGTAVKDFKAGDRVVYLCGLETTGCFHTFGRVDQNVVVKIPDSMKYEIAAGLPCVYATVIYGLFDAARLQKGETILIHAAAGGVGQAAIHLAKIVGAEIYATVSSREKRELLMTEYNIPEDHIFSSRDLTFVKGIMRCTQNSGVDVVLNSLSGEALRRSWDCVAPFGRFVEVGKKDAQENGRLQLRPFLRNVTMTSVELPTMMRFRPQLIKRLTQDTVDLYIQGHIKEAKPTKVLNYSQVEEGLRTLQSGKGMGKMIFMPNPDDLIPLVPPELPPYKFDSNASYVLAGGLGGIGRSLARWMSSRGARSLIFLSRSGNITDPVTEMIKDLEANDCKAHIFTCDVSDKDSLVSVIEECKAKLPPIKGCIQGSMTLRDGMFENMSYADWLTTTRPKVQGSWNLHETLPVDMDFFVLLSSATGILGNRSQANYAAGNTYQDALAKYRLKKNLPAASIDLGNVLSVGYVAEHKEKAKQSTVVLEFLREEEIHALIEYLIDPRCPRPKDACQLVTGLTNSNSYRQRGIPAPTYLSYPLFTELRTLSRTHGSGDDDSSISVKELLSACTSMEEAVTVVTNGVKAKLASLLAIATDDIDPAKSISSNGVDSLVAMEFRTWLVKDVGADIPLLEIMGTNSLSAVCRQIAALSKLVQIAPA